ncbi:MAG: DNA-formamidopyrimidine glycosylase family protein [Planctomycetota bacterium]|jgi:formamidopyrimidine-DNA glycosylase
MPELPEVEFGRKLAERVALGRAITRVLGEADEIVYDGITLTRFRRALKGKKVLAVRRHGKQLWFELDARPWPLFHFGMTGAFHTPGDKALILASSRKGGDGTEAWPPRFTKLRLCFDGGGELCMTNKRRLGRIRLRDDPQSEAPIAKLGFDPLLSLPTPGEFVELAAKRRAPIKGLLLNQSFAAGVGNWIADEVLYQAGVDPRRRASDLSPAELRRIRSRLSAIIRKAVAVDARKSDFPKTWLFHHRWGAKKDATTARGERIRHIQVAGRTTAWVPSAQS